MISTSGGTVADIVRLNTYVANYRPAEGEIVNAANKKLFEGLTPPSMTLMGVQALYSPDVLCEVEATAVIG